MSEEDLTPPLSPLFGMFDAMDSTDDSENKGEFKKYCKVSAKYFLTYFLECVYLCENVLKVHGQDNKEEDGLIFQMKCFAGFNQDSSSENLSVVTCTGQAVTSSASPMYNYEYW